MKVQEHTSWCHGDVAKSWNLSMRLSFVVSRKNKRFPAAAISSLFSLSKDVALEGKGVLFMGVIFPCIWCRKNGVRGWVEVICLSIFRSCLLVQFYLLFSCSFLSSLCSHVSAFSGCFSVLSAREFCNTIAKRTEKTAKDNVIMFFVYWTQRHQRKQ